MNPRPTLVAMIVILLAFGGLALVPSACADNEKLRVTMVMEFTTLRTLSIDLTGSFGPGLEGERELSSVSQITSQNQTNYRMEALVKVLFTDPMTPSEVLSDNGVANSLIFGFKGTQGVSSVTGLTLFTYDNYFILNIQKITLSNNLTPVNIRPLVSLHQFPDSLNPDNDLIEAIIEVKLPEALGLTTTNLNGQYFRSLPNPKGEFHSTFRNTPAHIDPTDLVGVGYHYDIKTNEIEITELPTYEQPRTLFGIYVVCLLLSILLLKIKGRKYTDKKGYPLSINILVWAIIGLVFFMAFLPYSSRLFTSLCFGGFMLSILKFRAGKMLKKRGGIRKGPKLELVSKGDTTRYRKPGSKSGKPKLEPVNDGKPDDTGMDPGSGLQLDSLLGGGGSEAPASLEPLSKDDLVSVPESQDSGEFKPPEKERKSRKKKVKKVKKVKGAPKDPARTKEPDEPDPGKDGPIMPDSGPDSGPEEPGAPRAEDLLGRDEKPDDEPTPDENLPDLADLAPPGTSIEAEKTEEEPDEPLPELTRKPIAKGDKSALASRLAALDDLKKKL